jgi:diacylglycerol kinase family enzyme
MIRFFSRQEQHSAGVTGWHAKYPALLPAERTDIPGIHHVRAKAVTIAADTEWQDVTLDGEIRGRTPIYARVADERLRILLPKHKGSVAEPS